MELALREAQARLAELVAAALDGERVVITKHGEPVVELVPFRRTGGIDLDKLESACLRLGIKGSERGWPADFDDPALSRRILGLE